MTRVQVRFRLPVPLDEAMIARISDAHAIYGIVRIKREYDDAGLAVEFDASRLRPEEVRRVLARAGIPVEPK